MNKQCFSRSFWNIGITYVVGLSLNWTALAEDCQMKFHRIYKNTNTFALAPTTRNDVKMFRIIQAAKGIVESSSWMIKNKNTKEAEEFLNFQRKLKHPHLEFSYSGGPISPVKFDSEELAHYLVMASKYGFICQGIKNGVFTSSHAIRASFREGILQSKVTAIDEEIQRDLEGSEYFSASEDPIIGQHNPATFEEENTNLPEGDNYIDRIFQQSSETRPLLEHQPKSIRRIFNRKNDPYGLLEFFSETYQPDFGNAQKNDDHSSEADS